MPARHRNPHGLGGLMAPAPDLRHGLVQPLWVAADGKTATPGPLPLHGVADLLRTAEACSALGLRGFMLAHASPAAKRNDLATFAYDPKNPLLKAVAALRQALPQASIMAEASLAPYTPQGLHGIADAEGRLRPEESLQIIGEVALALANAGADVVAVPAMFDRRAEFLRGLLDDEGFEEAHLMLSPAYFHSAFHRAQAHLLGLPPGAEAGAAPHALTHPADTRGIMAEAEALASEGADVLWVQPAGWAADVIHRLHEAHALPIAAYHSPGEYLLLQQASHAGLDAAALAQELVLRLRAAGAGVIITPCAHALLSA